MRAGILFCAMMGLVGQSQAATFAVPAGCAAYLTVQASNCTVHHFWTCESDVVGTQWHGEVGLNGLSYVGKINSEAQWVESFFVLDNMREELISGATDPANLSDLFANGLDTYDFDVQTSTGVQRVVGFDRIVDRDVIIDGEPLFRTEYTIRKTNASGEVMFASEGTEYVSQKHRRFFSGSGWVTGPDEPYRYNAAPIEFIYPSDPDFLEKTPKYGCDVVTTSMPLQ